MNQQWFEDMMSQTYNEDICYNPSKLFLMQFISQTESIKDKYKIKDFQDYLFRIYIDNPNISCKHPSYIIRNLGKYGTTDLCEHAMDTLESWDRDAKNSILKFGKKYFVLQVDLTDGEDIAKNTLRLAKMIYKKTYNDSIPNIKEIGDTVCNQNDFDLDDFGIGEFRNRVFEDIQYCPICEEIASDKLVAVHICDKTMEVDLNALADKNNGLLFCKKHAKQYIENKFYFDEMGFAHNIKDSDVEPGMHLSFSIRKPERRNYLAQKEHYLKEQGML